MRALILFILLCQSAQSASLWVSLSGSDGNPGTFSSPWRTAAKAALSCAPGDTVNLAAGDFAEYVQTSVDASSAQIVWQSTNGASLRGFRMRHAGYTLRGIHLTGFSDANNPFGTANGAYVRIEAAANNTVVTNCLIDNLPYVANDDFTFNATSNLIHSSKSDFVAAGFVPGSHVFLGSASSAVYTNHNTTWCVKALDAHDMVLTNTAGDAFGADAGTYWAAVYAGDGARGCDGVLMITAAGVGATNCLVLGNTITNIVGAAADLCGTNAIMAWNKAGTFHGIYSFVLSGQNVVIISNTFCPMHTIIDFTTEEINSVPHDSQHYDYADANVSSSPAAGLTVSNCVVAWNYFGDNDNQMMTLANQSTSYGLTVTNNIFAGAGAQVNMSRRGARWWNNTFWRCAFDEAGTVVLATSSLTNAGDVDISSNLFANCGNHANLSTEGFYNIAAGQKTNYNFVTGPEVAGWPAKSGFNEPNGINGGDPLFLNPSNPLGPDGIPFTADDGLQPLPNSPAARLHIGALGPAPVTPNWPIAHFTFLSPNTGWNEDTTTNYDPVWLAKAPWARGGRQRPWTNADAITNIPLWTTFCATGSVDGISTTNYIGIYWYHWDFGDGGQLTVYRSPYVRHLFTSTGVFNVILSVTNALTNWSVYSNAYKIQGIDPSFAGHLYQVATNGSDSNDGLTAPFLTIQKAANVVNPGDVVRVNSGNYTDVVTLARSSAQTNRITFAGYGATNGSWQVKLPDYTIDGFSVNGTNLTPIVQTSYVFYLYSAASRTELYGNRIFGCTNVSGISLVRGSDGYPSNSPSSCIISNNLLDDMWGTGSEPLGIVAYGQSNRFLRNVFRNNQGQADCYRVWGMNQEIDDNYVEGLSTIQENHTDFYQIFGPQSAPSDTNAYDFAFKIYLRRNWVRGGQMSMGQMQMDWQTNAPNMWSNIVYQEDIFEGITNALSGGSDGVKIYNCLFKNCPVQGSSVFVGGGSRSTARGMESFNNIYFGSCGQGNPTDEMGWYDGRMDQREPTGTPIGDLIADCDYVCGTNSYDAKRVSPPDNYQHWASFGWEAHGINGGNPLFNNDGNDWHLQVSSPLYQRGISTNFTPVTDFDGRPWDGGVPSIGPFQMAAPALVSASLKSVWGNVLFYGTTVLH